MSKKPPENPKRKRKPEPEPEPAAAAEDQPTAREEVREERVRKLKEELFGEMLTSAEVAEVLEVHPRTVGEYIREGKLRGIQIGGGWRVPESSLREFVLAATLRSPSGGQSQDDAWLRIIEAGRAQRSGRGGRSMFDRFTDRARRVVVLAQDEARLMYHAYIGTEHLLLGLVAEEKGIAARAITKLGGTLGAFRAELEQITPRGSEKPVGHIPFTPRSKKVLEMSLREALELGHTYIGTEHILLGLLREGEGVAVQMLERRGLSTGQVRVAVLEMLRDEPAGERG